LLGCLVTALLMALPEPALALRIRVSARARLTVDVVHADTAVAVRGRLLDVRGRGVGDAAVNLRVWQGADDDSGDGVGGDDDDGADRRAMTATAVTSARGFYEARMTGLIIGKQVRVRAVFAGSPQIAATTLARSIHLAKRTPKLRVRAQPSLLTTDISALDVAAFAGISDHPLGDRTIKLHIDGQPARALKTGEDGWATLRLPTAELMPPGVHELVFELPQTKEDNAATARAVIEVHNAVVVSLARAGKLDGGPCEEREICLRGEVALVDPGG